MTPHRHPGAGPAVSPSSPGAESFSWRAPGRVNLIGEHTDYNDGFVLPLAIEQGCTAVVGRNRDAAEITVRSRQRPVPVTIPAGQLVPGAAWLSGPSGWAGYAAGVLWAMAHLGHSRQAPAGVTIELDSAVPVGAGLSSSAAIGCSVAGAVGDLLGLTLSGQQLAEVARDAETGFVGAPTGGMDQLASALGAPGQVMLCDMRSRTVEPIPLDLDASGLALLVVDTGVEHRHVDGAYRRRREACQEAAAQLGITALRDADLTDLDRLEDDALRRRARHVITENDRVLKTAALLRSGNVAGIGPVLTSSHLSMREDFEITVPVVDAVVEALLDAGALGARMTGGGFGGCVIGLLRRPRVTDAAEAVTSKLARAGLNAPASIFLCRPGAGAHRVRAEFRVGDGLRRRNHGTGPPSRADAGDARHADADAITSGDCSQRL